MIYHYIIKIEYIKGNIKIIKTYKKDFLTIIEFFNFLEKKHKDNYTIISIKEDKYPYI